MTRRRVLQDNIQNYLHGCKKLGVPESSLFNTIDLFEDKNINMARTLWL